MAKLTREDVEQIIKAARENSKSPDLRRHDLSNVALFGANLSQVDLNGANLRQANLSQADLSQANLRNAVLIEAHLS